MKNEPIAGILAAASKGTASHVAEELIEPGQVFHAPVATSQIDALLSAYEGDKARMLALCEHLQREGNEGALSHLISGNAVDFVDYYSGHSKVRRLMQIEGGIKSLNSTYWERALALTDVIEAMPQARRSEWQQMIHEKTAPDFEESTVRHTLLDLLNSRERFFAERVDGIFRNLSRDHVTNSPEGFSKRMIIARAFNSWGSVDHEVAGYISDLRNVIARFMGAGESTFNTSYDLIARLRKDTGTWKFIDGSALRIKLFKKGTVHLEVHPDMAWRLNAQLAALYPAAIPSKFRKPPVQRCNEFPLLQKTVSRHILQAIAALQVTESKGQISAYLRYGAPKLSDQVQSELSEVLTAFGAIEIRKDRWDFDYDPRSVFLDLIDTGVIPDERAHQLYETPDDLAEYVHAEADAVDSHSVLEPSAGRGRLATRFLPSQTTCVEVSAQNCKILEAKGYEATQTDFLDWAAKAATSGRRWDRIVMNPPWANKRAQLHTVAASRLVAKGGRLVAVLPGSLVQTLDLPGFTLKWSPPFHRRFATTDVTAFVLTADRLPG